MKLLKLKFERYNRSTFILSVILSYIILMIAGSLLGGLLILMFMLIFGPSTSQMNIGIFIAPFIIIWALYFIYCAINRFHDLGMSGWCTLVVFVPFLGFIFGILLLFISGNENSNKYGEPQCGTYLLGRRLNKSNNR